MSHVRPVVLGGDIGVYAIARQLHTATTSRVTVLSPAPIEAISLSSYIDVVPLPEEPTEEDTIAALLEVAEDLGEDERAVVMANTDHQAALLARHRHLLEPAYAVPFPPSEVIDAVSDKTSFSALCASVGVDTPRQVVVDMSDCDEPGWAAPQIDMPFPVVAKAAVGEAYDILADSVPEVVGTAASRLALPAILVAGLSAVPRGELAGAGIVSQYALTDPGAPGGQWSDGGAAGIVQRLEAMGERLARTWSR
mgnify:CR=1 FL=1